jgi:hypothetical protein
MPVPETAMNENGSIPTGKDDIRSSRQAPDIDPETKALGMKRPPKKYLRLGIGSADP